MVTELPIVFADITQLIVALAIIIFSILGSIVQSRQEAAKRERQKRSRPPKPARKDIEVLLQEAERPRNVQPAGRQDTLREVRLPEASMIQSTESLRPLSQLPEPDLLSDEVVQAEVVPPTRRLPESPEGSVAEHVARTFQRATGEAEISRRPFSRKGKAKISQQREAASTADSLSEPPLFHGGATREALPPAPEVTETPPHPLSQALLQTFATPEGMAAAVVLRDVIERPEWRWRRKGSVIKR